MEELRDVIDADFDHILRILRGQLAVARPNVALLSILLGVCAMLGLCLSVPVLRDLFRFGVLHLNDLATTSLNCWSPSGACGSALETVIAPHQVSDPDQSASARYVQDERADSHSPESRLAEREGGAKKGTGGSRQ